MLKIIERQSKRDRRERQERETERETEREREREPFTWCRVVVAVRLVTVRGLSPETPVGVFLLHSLIQLLRPRKAAGTGMQRFYLFISLCNGLSASLHSYPNGHCCHGDGKMQLRADVMICPRFHPFKGRNVNTHSA